MFGETVTRIRRVETGTPDRYGNPEYTDEETAVDGAAFAPGGTSEPVEVGRTPEISAPTLYFKSRPDFRADDRVRVRGLVYMVQGDPADWRSPWTPSFGGLVVPLKRVEG